jgi:hypothetical protein
VAQARFAFDHCCCVRRIKSAKGVCVGSVSAAGRLGKLTKFADTFCKKTAVKRLRLKGFAKKHLFLISAV